LSLRAFHIFRIGHLALWSMLVCLQTSGVDAQPAGSAVPPPVSQTIRQQSEPRLPSAAAPEVIVEPNTWQERGAAYLSLMAAVISPDGKLVALSDRVNVTLWDLATGRRLRNLRNDLYVTDLTFSPDSRFVFASYKDGNIRRWNVASGAVTRLNAAMPTRGIDHQAPLKLALAGRDRLVVVGDQGAVSILRLDDRGNLASTRAWPAAHVQDRLESAWVSPDGRRAVMASDNRIVTVDLETGTRIAVATAPKQMTFTHVVNDRDVLAVTVAPNCEVGSLVLVRPFTPASGVIELDPAPTCKSKKELAAAPFTIVSVQDGARVYTKREGVAGYRLWRDGNWRQPSAAPALSADASLIGGDPQRLVTSSPSKLAILDGTTGSETITLGGPNRGAFANAIVSDRGSVHSGSVRDTQTDSGRTKRLQIWQAETLQPLSSMLDSKDIVNIHDVSLAADRAIGDSDTGELVVIAPRTGREVSRRRVAGLQVLDTLRLSPDGRTAFVSGNTKRDETGRGASVVIDIASGATKAKAAGRVAAFSQDGALLAVARGSMQVDIFRVADGAKIKFIDTDEKHQQETPRVLTFSGDGRYLLGGTRDGGLFLWSLSTAKLVRVFERKDSIAGHVNIASTAISPDGTLIAGGLAMRSSSSGDEGQESGILLWDARSGRLLKKLRGHEAGVTALSFTPDGRWLVSSSYDGSIRYWYPATGQLAATAQMDNQGRWSIVTTQGFVAGSPEVAASLSVVNGMTATRLDQAWRALYHPDLVRDFIAGDPAGEVIRALRSIDIPKVLASGAPPRVAISSIEPTNADRDDVIVRYRVTDQGDGIGRVEIRVNGVTSSVVTAANESRGANEAAAQRVILDPGSNTIDVVAFNRRDLIASVPASMTYTVPASPRTKSKLHILAIGVDKYTDTGWQRPGATSVERWSPLTLAVKDARAAADRIRRAAGDLHSEVVITTVLDEQATRLGIEAAMDTVASRVGPHDTFILYIAGHGTTANGQFYFVPQDFQSGPGAYQKAAIGQDRFQDWLANKIRARRALVLLDTCQSGALVAGHLRSRIDAPASEAGIGRLHEATGRPVLTAAAAGRDAFEGYRGHGFFTWAFLDAFDHGDADRDGTITLSELVAHVQTTVQRISLEGSTGRALNQTGPASGSAQLELLQTARFGSRGEDFPIARAGKR
jgi:WD40 repeat protein